MKDRVSPTLQQSDLKPGILWGVVQNQSVEFHAMGGIINRAVFN